MESSTDKLAMAFPFILRSILAILKLSHHCMHVRFNTYRPKRGIKIRINAFQCITKSSTVTIICMGIGVTAVDT